MGKNAKYKLDGPNKKFHSDPVASRKYKLLKCIKTVSENKVLSFGGTTEAKVNEKRKVEQRLKRGSVK